MVWIHIVGGGVAGLSLASELSKHKILPGSVVVSDPNFNARDDRTYSFWSDRDHSNFLPGTSQYSKWVVSSENGSVTQTGKNWHYYRISGRAFYEKCKKVIERHPQCFLNRDTLVSKPSAKYVFDSRPPSTDRFRAYQSFVGIEINCEHNFAKDVALLMTNMRAEDSGLYFEYMLPITNTSLLIESTYFGAMPGNIKNLEKNSLEWIKNNNLTGKIIRKEKAHIPMGLRPSTNDDWGIPIGARGGMTRASSGYGFMNMRSWAKITAKTLTAGKPITKYRPPLLETWMDLQLIKIIQEHPQHLPKIFLDIAQKTKGDDFASFLTKARPLNALQVITSAPAKPFLKSIMQMIKEK